MTYAVAWFFSLANLLLITGHIAAIFCATLLAEAAARMGDRQKLAGASQLTQSLALICILALLYAFYPMIRMFLDSDEPFLAAIEAKNLIVQRAWHQDNWKLVAQPDGFIELYDLDEDPGEIRNLATAKQHRDKREALLKAAKSCMASLHDTAIELN